MGIGLLLELGTAMAGDQIAVSRGAQAWTFAELDERVNAAAAMIRASPARSVAYLGLNGPAFHVALFASARAGRPITPLNYRLAADQIAALLAQLEDPIVIADEAYAAVTAGHPVITTEELLRLDATDQIADECADDSPAVVLFTSGTTSVPKGVVLRHSNLVSYVLQTVEPGSAEPTDAALVCVPPYHIAGVGTVLTNTLAGRHVVHVPNFTADGWLEVAAKKQVTSAMVVPTMLARIVEHLGDAIADIPSLRSIAYGGARIPPSVLARALRAFPEAGFVNAYGLTETSSTIALLGPEDHRAALASRDPAVAVRLGSAGRFVPGIEGEIRDEHGSVLLPGETGELWVRGPQVSGEYLEVGNVVNVDGWFPTRDRAHLDEDGYLFVEGRADDTIIRGGENIAPAEVEDVLAEHPSVREVAVIGVPDEQWGERLVAVVVLRAPAAAEELEDFVRSRLRGSRTPDDIYFRDELPMTPTGKIIRRDLIDSVLRN
jgi:acyl-CoA synthetase (AMP-forming)/AMP-acid ligase II